MSESAIYNSVKTGPKLWGWGPASMQVQCYTHCAYMAQSASGIALFTEHLLYIRAKDTEPAIGHRPLNQCYCTYCFMNK